MSEHLFVHSRRDFLKQLGEQIARAVELGLGVDNPARVELVTADDASEIYAAQIRALLARG